MLPALLIANLGCEDALADRPLRSAALRRAAACGTLLRAFAADDDTLWLPHALQGERLTPLLPRPRLVTGPIPAAEVTLPWCAAEEFGGSHAHRLALDDALARRLWSLPRPDPRVTATVNHKAFALLLARDLGEALPLAAALSSLPEIEDHLRRLPPGARWVAKHPLAAAGRARLWGAGQSLTPTLRNQLAKLLHSAGVLIVEPWMERLRDVGRAALLDNGRTTILARYQQGVGPKGEFRGICLDDPLSPELATRFDEMTLRVGRALHERGYRGPFSIDGWSYLREGKEVYHLLGEINARITFGLIAHVIARRPETPVVKKLRLGDAEALRSARSDGPVWPLLLPGDDDATAIWIE